MSTCLTPSVHTIPWPQDCLYVLPDGTTALATDDIYHTTLEVDGAYQWRLYGEGLDDILWALSRQDWSELTVNALVRELNDEAQGL